MRVEFNKSGFSATMEDENKNITAGNSEFLSRLTEKKSFLFGLIAVIIAIINLPFGLFINFSAEIFNAVFETGIMHWVVALCVLSLIGIAIAISLAVLSIVSYARSPKGTSDTLGFIMSIFAFIIGAICLVLNIMGVTLW